MEKPEEFVASDDPIMKRKRTKRHRPASPFAMVSRSSSGSSGGGGGGVGEFGSISSPTTSGEISTEEEEDMANCLILLAQGDGITEIKENGRRRLNELPVAGKSGFYVYECKTCNRSFPSFQALGGHRASHKRPKITPEDKKVQFFPANDELDERVALFNKNSSVFSLQIATGKNSPSPASLSKTKIHECSICGSEFSSGQALGGHMRRHRATATTQIAMEMNSNQIEKPRNILSLDLNLPAPEDDRQDSKIQFTSTQQPLVFSGPALVDCYY